MSLPLADSGVEERGFVAWVGSNEQQQVTVLDAGDARVQQVVGAQVGAADRERKKIGSADKAGDTLQCLQSEPSQQQTRAVLPCPRRGEDFLGAQAF